MTWAMIVQALLFDLGGVIIEIDFDRAVASWAAAAGLPVDTLRPRFSFDEAYQRHERGEITGDEYFAALRASLGIDVPDGALVTGWNAIYVGEVPGMRALLHAAGDRWPLYALTNSNPTHHAFSSVRYADVLKPEGLRVVRAGPAQAGAGSVRGDRGSH
jgi:glucose-1-phosphatase